MDKEIGLMVSSLIDAFAPRILSFAEIMAAMGVLSMAVIQTVKDMLPARRWFHQISVVRHLRTLNRLANESEFSQAQKDLYLLACGGLPSVLFRLPIEQLCGQLNAALQAALENPSAYPAVLKVFAPNSPQDLAALAVHEAGREQEVALARGRVSHGIQRTIDAIQILVSSEWQWTMRAAATGVSGILCMMAVQHAAPSEVGDANRALVTLAAGLMGGFLAPVARDLVAALQQLRK